MPVSRNPVRKIKSPSTTNASHTKSGPGRRHESGGGKRARHAKPEVNILDRNLIAKKIAVRSGRARKKGGGRSMFTYRGVLRNAQFGREPVGNTPGGRGTTDAEV